MKSQNAVEMQQQNVRIYKTGDFAQAFAPGWRVPLVNLGYAYEDEEYHKGMNCLTYGPAAVVREGEYLVPLPKDGQGFAVGKDLAALIIVAGLVGGEFIDVWQLEDVRDWRDKDGLARRRVEGKVSRYYIAAGEFDGVRTVGGKIAIPERDVQAYAIELAVVLDGDEVQDRPVSKGCEVARAARERLTSGHSHASGTSARPLSSVVAIGNFV